MDMRLLKARWYKDARINPIFIILHHTASNNDTSQYLANNTREVSVHLHITRSGIVTRYTNLIDFNSKMVKIGWHAGKSAWTYQGKKYTNLNAYSIGIEMDGDGKTPFTDIQLIKMYELVRLIMHTWDIPAACVLGHKEISPGRKFDPSPLNMSDVRGKLHIPEPTATLTALRTLWTFIAGNISPEDYNGHPVIAAFNLIRDKWRSNFGE